MTTPAAAGQSANGSDPQRRARIRTALALQPDAVLEMIAREFEISTQSVLEAMPPAERLFVAGDRFEEIWGELASWGELLLVVHTPDIVLECKGALPIGSFAYGFYNFAGASPIHGHIKADSCCTVCLVDRLFHGRRSCSAQFFNAAGEAIFKIFVARNAARELLPEQVMRFEALWEKLSDGSASATRGGWIST